MSQTSPRLCPQCQAPFSPGQRYCQNCGALAEPSGPAPTVAASPPMPPPTMAASPQVPPTMAASQPVPPTMAASKSTPPPPNAGGLPYTAYPGGGSSPSYPTDAPPPPTYGTGNDPYSVAPPPPSDPYSMPNYQTSASPNTSYGGAGSYPSYVPPTGQKKRSPMLTIIIGIVVVLVVVCGGGAFAMNRFFSGLGGTTTGGGTGGGSNGGTGGSSFASKVDISNLAVTYADDQLTFTSLQQQAKFDDDSLTTYGSKSNYVRLSFSEKQTGKGDSIFSYTSAFKLVLPDGSLASSVKASQYTGPDQGEQRQSWIDFGTNGKIDLNTVKLRLGGSDEETMEFALKTGADVSQFQPKTINLNKQFNYATMQWTIKDATQSLYFDGDQAKKGKVFVILNIVINNNSSSTYTNLGSSQRLKSGSEIVAPDYSSDDSNFGYVKGHVSNIAGNEVFKVTKSSTGTYTLQLGKITDYNDNVLDPGKSIDIQFQ